MNVRLAVAGGCAAGLASGWNVGNVGAVAEQLGRSYGVGLATVGLFTTALYVTHLLFQVPGGRASDRFGARRVSLAGLVVIACFNGLALIGPYPALVVVSRVLVGVGTGLAFVSGSAYVRAQGGSPFAQGLFGGVALGGGGLALAIVPPVDDAIGWRAPFVTAIVVAVAGLVLLAAAPADSERGAPLAAQGPAGVFRDARLYRLAVLYAASLGLSVVIGNWVVTLLHRHGGLSKGGAGLVGALTLILGVATRPLGGWILRERPERMRAAVIVSLVAGGVGTALLATARPLGVAILGAALVGLAAGIPFAPAFTGAALTRPQAPAVAVGFVNGAAALVTLAGTPLVGLAFSLPGDGRLAFGVLAAVWGVALLMLPSQAQLGATAAIESRSG